jgi:hypothetical protein
MRESKPMYVIVDHEKILGLVWETELGKIVTFQGNLDIQDNLSIREVETGKEIDNIDLRNVLMSILPK